MQVKREHLVIQVSCAGKHVGTVSTYAGISHTIDSNTAGHKHPKPSDPDSQTAPPLYSRSYSSGLPDSNALLLHCVNKGTLEVSLFLGGNLQRKLSHCCVVHNLLPTSLLHIDASNPPQPSLLPNAANPQPLTQRTIISHKR